MRDSEGAMRVRFISYSCASVFLLFGVLATGPVSGQEKKTEYFKGKIVSLATLVEKFGGKLDADAAPFWLALAGEDGRIYPLLKDDGSRMFFKDARLLNRPVRLT